MTRTDFDLASRARDYQDLSAMGAMRARRLFAQDARPWVIAYAQEDAASQAAQARYLLSLLLDQGEVAHSPSSEAAHSLYLVGG